ncbi:FAD-dependent pyridine nucleotide-disulfide oxidoreductase [Salinisphaera sp. C84B14]|uniref:NAD(P)/FAD-dependent oxidoreductase n=1 Tax=Salinisphaera sp. C84B14 TaxID=1304155 RepID=UPI00334178D0
MIDATNAPAAHHRVLIAGGGTAGLSVASALLRRYPELDVSVIEPNTDHYYQPGWTLVGGGDMPQRHTRRAQADVMPEGARWIQDTITGFEPEASRVTLASGAQHGYDVLVVALGLQLNWDAIDGLVETLGRNGVTSNYHYDYAPYTHELASTLAGGRALFTQPAMPIKCAGAPQKALYLTADTLRRRGVNASVEFYNQGASMFGVPVYARELDKVIAGYGATPYFGHDLIAVDGERQHATFKTAEGEVTRDFDMLHVVPPQSAPAVIRDSSLAGAAGWVSVDRHRLNHTVYPNVFALGDCTDTPNAKTMAAVRRQVPTVVDGVLNALELGGEAPLYDGYGACPLTVEHGRVLLAEFRYDQEVVSSFPLDPRQPRRLHWLFKRHVFPMMYWQMMLCGHDWRRPHPRSLPELSQ